MNRLRSGAFSGLLGLLTATLVACSSTAGPTPTPSPTATLALPSISLPNNAKELEALLPDFLGGTPLQKFAWSGSDFVNSQSGSPELKTWLQSLGKSLSDISAALAFVPTGEASIFAFRVVGVDHTSLIAAYQRSIDQELKTTLTWTSASVGGKSVQTAVGRPRSPRSDIATYLYGYADIIFVVETGNAALAAEALSHLP